MIEQITIEQFLNNKNVQLKLSNARAEKAFQAEIGAKPKFHPGKYGSKYDYYTCGNCGSEFRTGIVANYCSSCGFRINWATTRCLTK